MSSENKQPLVEKKRSIRYKKLHVCNIVLLAVFLCSMIPVAVASQYVYPQADDFSYSVLPHMAWDSTHNLFAVLQQAWEQVVYSYTYWQGTYTSVFLMSLQPGIWSLEAYHIVPLLMVAMLALATWYFIDTVLHRLLNVDRTLSNGISILVILISVQNVPEPSEAFTWFNGAIHYTGMHALWLVTFAVLLRKLFGTYKTKGGCRAAAVLLCVLQVLSGGGNNLTVLEADCIEAVLGFFILVFSSKEQRKPRFAKFLFFFVFLLAGSLANFLAPGNSVRLGEGPTRGIAETILYSFKAGIECGTDWLTISMLIFLLWLLPYLVLTIRELSEHVRFRYPWLVILAVYCLFSAIWAPLVYTGGNADSFMNRTRNAAYYHYVLFVTGGMIYLGGAVYQRIRQKKNGPVVLQTKRKDLQICWTVVTLLVTITGAGYITVTNPMHYFTSSAVHCIASGGGQKWKETILANFEKIENAPDDPDADIVLTEPVTEERFLRTLPYENEIGPWRSGLNSYYGRTGIHYEGEQLSD